MSSLALLFLTTSLASQNDAVSVQAVQNFGKCIVDETPSGARRVLQLDYREPEYSERLRAIVKGHDRCLAPGSKLASSGVLLAGALAEAMLEKEIRARDIAARLAPDPNRAQLVARDETEAMALCTVQIAPESTARMVQTEPATKAEADAMQDIVPVLGQCLKKDVKLTLNRPALRAVLSLAAWRIASAPEAAE